MNTLLSMMGAGGQGQSMPPQSTVLSPIISVPIPMSPLGNRLVPPPSEPQQIADYDYTLNTLKPTISLVTDTEPAPLAAVKSPTA